MNQAGGGERVVQDFRTICFRAPGWHADEAIDRVGGRTGSGAGAGAGGAAMAGDGDGIEWGEPEGWLPEY